MEIRVLGPLEVVGDDGEPRRIGSRRHREVLAALAIDPGRVVSSDSLVERVWGEGGASVSSLQAIVSRLRGTLGEDSILTQAPGYRLSIGGEQVDSHRFEAGLTKARATASPEEARRHVEQALALWRGTAYADVSLDVAEAESARLAEVRLSGDELLAEIDLQLGRHSELTQRLPGLLAAHPLRESLRGSLMLALYRCGRQAEALALYDDARAVLAEELGIDPGPQLQRLHRRILQQDPELMSFTVAQRVPTTPLPEQATHQETPRTGMVGRAEQLASLAGLLARAEGGSAGAAVVVGEAGIGKTTLVNEALTRHAAEPLVGWGRCWDHGGTPAYWPWEQALSGLAEAVGPETLSAAVHGRAEAATALIRGAKTPDLLGDHGPEVARARLYDAVVAFLEAIAGHRAVVVVLEDLHWADRESIELTEYVTATLRAARIAVIVTVRDPSAGAGQGQELVAALSRTPSVERIRLGGLSVPEVQSLVEQRTGARVQEGVARSLRERTEGNPFYIDELARLLAEERRVSGRADVPVPSSVRAVIEQRLHHLAGLDQELLRIASIVGRTFDLGVLAAVSGSPRWELMESLDRAVQAGLLSSDQPGSEQRFTHALVQETLALTIGPMRRAALHARVAAVLEQRRGDEETRAAAVAHHYAAAGLAGDPAKGVEWSLRAASYAERRLALHEAERSVRQALELVNLVSSEDADALELDGRVHLGSLLTWRLGYNAPEVAAERRRALELAEHLGSVGQPLISALWGSWGNALVSGDFDQALEICARTADVAARAGEPLLTLMLHAARGQTLWHLGRFVEAQADLARAVEEARVLGDAVPVDLFLQHPGLQAMTWLAVVSTMRGQVAEADRLATACLTEAEELRHPFTLAYVHIVEGLRCIWTGRHRDAVDHASQAMAIAQEQGYDQLAAFSLLPLGWGQGADPGPDADPGTGEALLQTALDAFGSLPTGHMFGHLMLALRADVQSRAGRFESALSSLDEALGESTRTGERFHLVPLHRLRAEVLHELGRDSTEELATAERIAVEQDAFAVT